MRITEKIVIQGNFWLPSESDNKISGTLTISDGGKIELEVTDVFGKGIEKFNDAVDIPRIQGETERGPVTLEKCFYTNTTFSFPDKGINISRIYVNMAMFNTVDETATFNTLYFSVEGLEQWLRLPAITVDLIKSEPQRALIKYSRPEDIFLFSNDGMKAQLTFRETLTHPFDFAEAKIKFQANIRLHSEEKKPLSDFIGLVHMLNTFFCFAIDKTICIKNVLVRSTEYTKYMKSTEIFYQSRIFSPETRQTHSSPMLFWYAKIKNKFPEIIEKWWKMYESTNPALHFYFEKPIKYTFLYDKFLVLAQVLEIYHRKTCKNNLKLEARILNLLNLLENLYAPEINISIENIAEDIAGIRNYLIHYDNIFKDKVHDPELLNFLCLKMELVFQLHLLKGIGFTDGEIKQVVEQSGLRQKLDWKLQSAKD